MGRFFSNKVRKRGILWFVRVFFAFLQIRTPKKNTACERQIYFVYVDIWFDLAKCKFIVKNSSFKILVMLSPIFVADTKITLIITLVDNFVAPLKTQLVDY